MRRFSVIDKRTRDVLIVDEEGSDSIEHCIPSLNSYVVIPTRTKIPILISIKFYYRYILRVINKQGFRLSILYSIIDIVDPKVIISFIDNASKMGKIQIHFPNKLIISVQNGLRTQRNPFPEKVPNLYGFGYYERDLLSDINSSVISYDAIGSLRYGIFIDKHKFDEANKYDVCYISQFSPHNEAFVVHLEKKYFDRLVKACMKNKYNLTVALRTPKDSSLNSRELEHFSNLDKNNYANYFDNNSKLNSSYELCFSSNMIVSFSSTLAYEFFGAGKKVLFLGSGSKELIRYHGEKIFSRMPKEVCVDNLSLECIEKKISKLMMMPKDEYLTTIKSAQEYYMNFNSDYPHNIIKNRINNFINA